MDAGKLGVLGGFEFVEIGRCAEGGVGDVARDGFGLEVEG
jgi:hypothetical protein